MPRVNTVKRARKAIAAAIEDAANADPGLS